MRNRRSLNQRARMLGLRTATSDRKVNRMVLGKPAIEGESPVCENRKERQDPEYYETRGTL